MTGSSAGIMQELKKLLNNFLNFLFYFDNSIITTSGEGVIQTLVLLIKLHGVKQLGQ